MKTYAVIENNIVTNIVIGDDEWAAAQEKQVVEFFNSNSAYIGGEYVDGIFYKGKPFPSWIKLNGGWSPPTPMPTSIEDGKAWLWDETIVSWVNTEVSDPSDQFID
jgi:hypothetical protein